MKKIPLFFLFGLLLLGAQSATAQTPDSPKAKRSSPGVQASVNADTVSLTTFICEDLRFDELTRLISTLSGLKIISSPEAAKTQISVYLPNVTPIDGLNAICRSYNLWLKQDEENNIIYIQTLEEFRKSIKVVNQDVVELIPVMYPSAQDIGEAINNLFTDRISWTREDNYYGGDYEKVSSALSRMDLLGQRGTLDNLNGGSGGGSSSGGSGSYGRSGVLGGIYGSYGSGYGSTSGSYGGYGGSRYNNNSSRGGNSMYSTETQRQYREMLDNELNRMQWKEIHELYKTAKQNEINAQKLTDNPGMIYMSTFSNNNVLLVRSSDPQAVKQIKEIVKQLDKPSPQVLLEVKVLQVKIDDTNQRALDFMFKSNDGNTSGGTYSGPVPSLISAPSGGGVSENRAATFSAINKNFEFHLKLIRTDDHATVLATPNLIVSDGEASNLFSGIEATILEKAEQELAVVAGLNNTSASGWNITAPRRKIGTSLVFTPKIHADRTVTIRLLQEQSNIGKERNIVYFTSTDTSSLTQQFQSQDIDYQSVTTTVVAKDQNLVVIGGLIQEQTNLKKEKVPFLCDIPVLGEYLFTRLAEERIRSELLVLIRPYVLLAPGESEKVSRNLMERLSQHPSATGDIPQLGVTYPDEIAKPRKINPNDPWLIRSYDRLRSWGVDDGTAPDVNNAANDYQENVRKADAKEEVKNIQNLQKEYHPESAPSTHTGENGQ